jgi:hypothetical protein
LRERAIRRLEAALSAALDPAELPAVRDARLEAALALGRYEEIEIVRHAFSIRKRNEKSPHRCRRRLALRLEKL